MVFLPDSRNDGFDNLVATQGSVHSPLELVRRPRSVCHSAGDPPKKCLVKPTIDDIGGAKIWTATMRDFAAIRQFCLLAPKFSSQLR
jgi:hypothetical protein